MITINSKICTAMQIGNPTWYLKITCPHCGQGYPTFCLCPNCKYLAVVCNETGDTFINPKNLEQGFTDICPNCNKIKMADFISADSDDILKNGFTKKDYE
jgi:hypothetical protein